MGAFPSNELQNLKFGPPFSSPRLAACRSRAQSVRLVLVVSSRIFACVRAVAAALGAVHVGLVFLVSAEPLESPLDSAERVSQTHASSFDRGNLVERLRAIRAAPFGEAPEASLDALARIAAGRDPSAAAVAVVAVRRIASRLDRGTIDAHETDIASLERAERTLRSLVTDQSARADIRRFADLSAAEIAAVRSPH